MLSRAFGHKDKFEKYHKEWYPNTMYHLWTGPGPFKIFRVKRRVFALRRITQVQQTLNSRTWLFHCTARKFRGTLKTHGTNVQSPQSHAVSTLMGRFCQPRTRARSTCLLNLSIEGRKLDFEFSQIRPTIFYEVRAHL